MKKRAKNSFNGASHNVLFALLVLAAAVTVYGVAQAAVVSHQGFEIVGQVSSAAYAEDSGLLQGLTAAEILEAGGGATGLYGWAQVDIYRCPNGPISTDCYETTAKSPAFCSKDGTFSYECYGAGDDRENQVANCSAGYKKVRLSYTCEWQEIGGVVDTECRVIRFGDKQGYFSCYKLP